MKNFDSLVDIWQTQKNIPDMDYQVIISRFKKSQHKLKFKIAMGLAAMVLIVITLFFLWMKSYYVYITTHIGLAIFALCGLYYIFTQVRNLKFLGSVSFTETPKKHLEKLRTFKLKRYKENTRNFLYYSVAMGLGFCLYFIEFFTKVNSTVMYLSITLTIFWFALCYFYNKKVFAMREEKQLAAMLKDLGRIEDQFK